MKKSLAIVLVMLVLLTSCIPLIHHSDSFYDYNDDDFPRNYLPLVNPINATQINSKSPWSFDLFNVIWIDIPGSLEEYPYASVEEVEKIAVKDGVIMAYSSFIDEEANPYILVDYYHWFVTIPSENTTKGFHTEDEFLQYIETLGIKNPDWTTPNDAYDAYVRTGGCLAWIPDCEQK